MQRRVMMRRRYWLIVIALSLRETVTGFLCIMVNTQADDNKSTIAIDMPTHGDTYSTAVGRSININATMMVLPRYTNLVKNPPLAVTNVSLPFLRSSS